MKDRNKSHNSFCGIFATLILSIGSAAGTSALIAKNVPALAAIGESEPGLMAGYPLSTSGSTGYSSFLTHYFDNLTENFGMNYAGSCGYVALGMLLSYYDAYYDGNLVPAQYDVASVSNGNNLIDRRCSPGVLHDDYLNTGYSNVYDEASFDKWDYLDYIFDISSISLHAKLIEIGNTLSYYGFSDTEPATTSVSQRSSILSYYLQNISGLLSSQFTISYTDISNSYQGQQGAAKSDIISAVSSGNPVLVGIFSQNKASGHAVIAYDYDSNTQTIFYHPGVSHTGYSTHMTISEMSYTFIRSYMTVSFNLNNPSPGANYGIGVEGGADAINYFNYENQGVNWSSTHSHSFYHHYQRLSNSYHASYCACGDYVIESHVVESLHYFHGVAFGTCSICGGNVTL